MDEDKDVYKLYVDACVERHHAAFINEPSPGLPPNCVFFFNGFDNVIEVRTLKDVRKGEEASMNYTAKGNKKTYQHAGAGTFETHGIDMSSYPRFNHSVNP